jgi:hypothetical protein
MPEGVYLLGVGLALPTERAGKSGRRGFFEPLTGRGGGREGGGLCGVVLQWPWSLACSGAWRPASSRRGKSRRATGTPCLY